jgi:hypothetical protein
MKKGMSIAITFTVIAFLSCSDKSSPEKHNSLLGSWDLTEVHWISTDTIHTLKKSKLGALLFTPESYSIMWSPTSQERVPFKVLSNPTDEEIIAGFRSIVFNTGSYMLSDTTITTKSTLAKVPGFEGGTQYYSYTVKDHELLLTMFDEQYPNGNQPHWSGIWKTKFFFKKKEK